MKKLKKYINQHWGIWNGMSKEFQFGIDEPTPSMAEYELWKKIGYDSYKWRFEPKILPKELYKRENDNIVYAEFRR